jgi:hypothetical protein
MTHLVPWPPLSPPTYQPARLDELIPNSSLRYPPSQFIHRHTAYSHSYSTPICTRTIAISHTFHPPHHTTTPPHHLTSPHPTHSHAFLAVLGTVYITESPGVLWPPSSPSPTFSPPLSPKPLPLIFLSPPYLLIHPVSPTSTPTFHPSPHSLRQSRLPRPPGTALDYCISESRHSRGTEGLPRGHRFLVTLLLVYPPLYYHLL